MRTAEETEIVDELNSIAERSDIIIRSAKADKCLLAFGEFDVGRSMLDVDL